MAANRWIYDKNELLNTPSRRSGISNDKELDYRQRTAQLIQDMGQKLQVSQLCINTGIVYMHRFYMVQSFAIFEKELMAASCLFLAAKVEEQPRKLEYVIRVFHMLQNRESGSQQPALDVKSKEYFDQTTRLVHHENILLQTLGFDITIDHPNPHVYKTCELIKAPKDLSKTSYFLATNSLHLTTMCLSQRPTVVACVCVHLACKWAGWEIPISKEGREWFSYIDNQVTLEKIEALSQDFLACLERYPTKFKKLRAATSNSKDGMLSMPKQSTPGSSSRDSKQHKPASFSKPMHTSTSSSVKPSSYSKPSTGVSTVSSEKAAMSSSDVTKPSRPYPTHTAIATSAQGTSQLSTSQARAGHQMVLEDGSGLRRVRTEPTITLSHQEYFARQKQREEKIKQQATNRLQNSRTVRDGLTVSSSVTGHNSNKALPPPPPVSASNQHRSSSTSHHIKPITASSSSMYNHKALSSTVSTKVSSTKQVTHDKDKLTAPSLPHSTLPAKNSMSKSAVAFSLGGSSLSSASSKAAASPLSIPDHGIQKSIAEDLGLPTPSFTIETPTHEHPLDRNPLDILSKPSISVKSESTVPKTVCTGTSSPCTSKSKNNAESSEAPAEKVVAASHSFSDKSPSTYLNPLPMKLSGSDSKLSDSVLNSTPSAVSLVPPSTSVASSECTQPAKPQEMPSNAHIKVKVKFPHGGSPSIVKTSDIKVEEPPLKLKISKTRFASSVADDTDEASSSKRHKSHKQKHKHKHKKHKHSSNSGDHHHSSRKRPHSPSSEGHSKVPRHHQGDSATSDHSNSVLHEGVTAQLKNLDKLISIRQRSIGAIDSSASATNSATSSREASAAHEASAAREAAIISGTIDIPAFSSDSPPHEMFKPRISRDVL